MYTESQANDLWCPLSQAPYGYGSPAVNRKDNGATDENCYCVASKCMMWRFTGQARNNEQTGYCGLAGKPKES